MQSMSGFMTSRGLASIVTCAWHSVSIDHISERRWQCGGDKSSDNTGVRWCYTVRKKLLEADHVDIYS